MEHRSVGGHIFQIAGIVEGINHQRAVTMVRLQRAVKLSRLHQFFLFPPFLFLTFRVGEQRYCAVLRYGNGDFNGVRNLFCWYRRFRSYFNGRCFHLLLLRFPTSLSLCPKFLSLFGCQVHHHLIESVDGRIVLPIDGCIDVIGVCFFGGILRFWLLNWRLFNLLRFFFGSGRNIK